MLCSEHRVNGSRVKIYIDRLRKPMVINRLDPRIKLSLIQQRLRYRLTDNLYINLALLLLLDLEHT